MRYITTSSAIGPSTILSILPFVLCFTQSLMEGTAFALAKSSPETFASKYCRDSSRNVCSNGKPFRYQIELAMRKSTVASSPRSMSISER